MTWRAKIWILIVVPYVALPCVAQGGPSPAPPQLDPPGVRLQRATASSAMDEVVSRPWHTVLAVTLFDLEGTQLDTATVEYWKNGADWKRKVDFNGLTQIEQKRSDVLYVEKTRVSIPSVIDQASAMFLHPGPTAEDMAGITPEFRKETFAKEQLDCIMLSRPLGHSVAPLGLFPTYCLDPASDRIVLKYDFGSRSLIINRVGAFLEHDAPIEFAITEGKRTVATAKLKALGTFTPAAGFFEPGLDMHNANDKLTTVAAGVISGHILKQVQPRYPPEARAAHISGTVTLRAHIGRDGHIYQLNVLSGPDANLALAALDAVRTWTYTPYELNGEPTEVDTTIVVNFRISSF